MSWGTKIIVVFSLFVGGILFMVVQSSRQNMDLVVPDYYEQELKFQEVIDATERTNALSSKVHCEVVNDSLQLKFPVEMNGLELTGELWLYCIADKKKDLTKKMITSDGSVSIPLTVLNKGLHEVKLSWTAAGIKYYQEQKLFIQ
ncbi:MAG: hypothetical protein EOO06_03870 [Chitinophagaceae bacterium]|nr:MAG: hypothetical protein EOO06_03870 [Chitinophagaceae bacterium]